MSKHERSTRSNLAIAPPIDELERFMQDENTGTSLATMAHRELSARTARRGAVLPPQSFAEALQALDDSNRRLQ